MKTPLISIIVPNYNHAVFLEQRLDSIFNQTFQDFEVILLDDCSSDNSIELLNTYAKNEKVSHLILNKENSGSPFKQWKKGIDLAKGKYIWIAESDDYCELTFLDKILKQFEKYPFIGLCYCQTLDVDNVGRPILNRINYTKEFSPNNWNNDFVINGLEFIKNYLIVKNVIPNASAVVYKKALIKQSDFTSDLINMSMCGDWFFWIKICQGVSISFTTSTCNYFRNHFQSSRSHNNISIKKTRILEEKVIRKYVFKTLGYRNYKAQNLMFQKWFKLHSKKSIFNKDFYKVLIDKRRIFRFIFIFLKS